MPETLIPDLATPAGWLPVVFLGLMAIAMLAYVVLDGYDLGVGVLLRGEPEADRDRMIAAIGPFWDANETWLVLGVGLLLVAFPIAHGVILGALYAPVALMLAGLILRGVAFEFRVKSAPRHKGRWDFAFFAGSLTAAFAQGVMLGMLVTGFRSGLAETAFALFIGACLVAGYALLGAGWLVVKTHGELQLRAVRWARRSLGLTALGIAAVSVATPLVSQRVFDRWFQLPELVLLAPIPLATALLFFVAWRSLSRLPVRLSQGNEYGAWVPFASAVGIFVLAFYGLAYSLFPYLVIDRLTIWDAASAPESLWIILVGALVVMPVILGYSALSYWIFRGKAEALRYG
jgi:cytochrome d ubiquinol oxidase subunit II